MGRRDKSKPTPSSRSEERTGSHPSEEGNPEQVVSVPDESGRKERADGTTGFVSGYYAREDIEENRWRANPINEFGFEGMSREGIPLLTVCDVFRLHS
ncbi:MAG: hypothetical protein ACOYN6_06520, partial [Ignavibacteria bacterium]